MQNSKAEEEQELNQGNREPMPLRQIIGLGHGVPEAWRQNLRMKNLHFDALKQ
jgi:hypothetical protein